MDAKAELNRRISALAERMACLDLDAVNARECDCPRKAAHYSHLWTLAMQERRVYSDALEAL